MGGNDSTFVTLLLPEYIGDQAVDLFSPVFERFMAVYKGRYKFNTNNRNGKRHAKIMLIGDREMLLEIETLAGDSFKCSKDSQNFRNL